MRLLVADTKKLCVVIVHYCSIMVTLFIVQIGIIPITYFLYWTQQVRRRNMLNTIQFKYVLESHLVECSVESVMLSYAMLRSNFRSVSFDDWREIAMKQLCK